MTTPPSPTDVFGKNWNSIAQMSFANKIENEHDFDLLLVQNKHFGVISYPSVLLSFLYKSNHTVSLVLFFIGKHRIVLIWGLNNHDKH